MLLSASDLENLEKLKHELQSEAQSAKLENLAAALLGRLLGLPISIAKSGFQHGGDAGPAGRQQRRFRIECKKYSDKTSLSDRELLGEIDHALARDDALETWILVATREVTEQLEQSLFQHGEKHGVPVVIIDWKCHELASLAALCAFDPDLVEAEFSKEAGALARALQPISADAITMLRRDLQSWSLGFETLRLHSHEKLDKIWSSPKTSNAELGQDAAGGAQEKRVKRSAVHQKLDAWWQETAESDAPAAVIGLDGVGKTWATLDWLVDNKNEQPIILIVPSSATPQMLSSISETSVKEFFANCLYQVSGVRSQEHWLRRLENLLKRPVTEGPVLTVFFDGMNQEPSIRWSSLLKVLQGEAFSGRVRVIVSTRNHHFEDKLSKLRGLIAPAVAVIVDRYDLTPGSELDQMLAFEGLSQTDLHSGLIELARIPRLFKLVVRFRNRLVEANQVTVHRLLWEYGRDTLGERAETSFSERDWRHWLKQVARKYRDGISLTSINELCETTSRPDLTEREVYARLSDIIDGPFANLDSSGNLNLSNTIVEHALGAALLNHLDNVNAPAFSTFEATLTQWLDPVAGLDQRAEILRAAVSILVEQEHPASSSVASVLVTAWLQTQNVTDDHRRELAVLAPHLTDALLDTVEHSDSSTHASARLWAVNALRAIPRDDSVALTKIVTRARDWFCIVSRDADFRRDANVEHEKARSDQFKGKIGTDSSGPIKVLGIDLELVDQSDGILLSTAPSIIEGFPLTKVLPVFEVAAVSLAIRRRNEGWDKLKWLCLLNETDPDETAAALRQLSKNIRFRTPETGVHADLPARAASLLLRISGQEQDEDAAESIEPDLDCWFSYEKDYLSQPSKSFFILERRHAAIVLNDNEESFSWRVQRTKELWLDPNFEPLDSFISEVCLAAASIEVGKLDRYISHTSEDYDFDQLEPVLARCAPDVFADLIQRKMQNSATCPAESRYWRAIRITQHFLLTGEAEATAARTLRLSHIDADQSHESFAANHLLMLEIKDLDSLAQYDALIRANLKFISNDFEEILQPLMPDEADVMIDRYGSGSSKQQDDLSVLLSIHSVHFSDKAWEWLLNYIKANGHFLGLAFYSLGMANAVRFGRILSTDGWSWNPEAHVWVNHYGTGALIEATRALPFDQVAPRLAPWRLLEAARLRGSVPTEVRLAAEIFGCVLTSDKIEEFDPGSILSVDVTETKKFPFTFSVSPQSSQDSADDPEAWLKAKMDIEAHRKAYRLASETAKSRIQEARKSGASLYLANVSVEDFEQVLLQAPDMVDHWLEGSQSFTANFRRRVHLSEGVFLALCEALLAHDSIQGAQLWRSLRETMTMNYVGVAGVGELLHMVFRAPDSPSVNALREELIELENCHTDQALYNVAYAASYNGKVAWLSNIIERDRASSLVWKRKRGQVLSGFTAHNSLPIKSAWPDGEIKTKYADIERKSARFQWIEACARHWWQTYLSAKDLNEAYAAWVLFRCSADQRAWIWMKADIEAADDKSIFFKLKISHALLNYEGLKNVMKKRIDKLDKNFLDREIVKGVGPWGKETHSV